MPKINLSVPHKLTVDEARERVQRSVADMKRHFGPDDMTQHWDNSDLQFGFSVKGLRITGTISVLPEKVSVVTKIPLVAAVFKGKIESQLRAAMERALDR